MMTNIKVNGANNFSNEGDPKIKMTDKIKTTSKIRRISEMKTT